MWEVTFKSPSIFTGESKAILLFTFCIRRPSTNNLSDSKSPLALMFPLAVMCPIVFISFEINVPLELMFPLAVMCP